MLGILNHLSRKRPAGMPSQGGRIHTEADQLDPGFPNTDGSDTPVRHPFQSSSFSLLLIAAAAIALPSLAADPLQPFEKCQLEPAAWADGDSFPVTFPDGKTTTVRLYGVDCIEVHIENDASNARRLLDQRRWFGITDTQLAVNVGKKAREAVAKTLARPFTVHTAFADARGDPRFSRIYGFITTADGKDLAEWLVSQGLARAFGVTRERPDGTRATEWKEQLKDLELIAARKGIGAWSHTDWDQISNERQIARKEEAEIAAITHAGSSIRLEEGDTIDPNDASRDELMALPGIGEAFANRIIEGRPYNAVDDLLNVSGIGPKTLEKLRPFLFLDLKKRR